MHYSGLCRIPKKTTNPGCVKMQIACMELKHDKLGSGSGGFSLYRIKDQWKSLLPWLFAKILLKMELIVFCAASSSYQVRQLTTATHKTTAQKQSSLNEDVKRKELVLTSNTRSRKWVISTFCCSFLSLAFSFTRWFNLSSSLST